MGTQTQIICLRTDAFEALIDRCCELIDTKFNLSSANTWVGPEEAMSILGISSRTTLQNYRDNGEVRFSQRSKKIIV